MRSLTHRRIGVLTTIVALGLFVVAAPPSGADGTETLGAPSVDVAAGSGVAIGGTGLHTQPGTIAVQVPAGASVEQVLLYWEGDNDGAAPADDTIVIEGTEVTGTLIGGETVFFSDVRFGAFRADITALGLVAAGANSLQVSGLTNTFRNNGAGVAVIYDDGTTADLELRDGLDLAFVDFAAPLDTTVPQTYTFAAEAADRTATLSLFAASVEDGRPRPNAIDVTIDGVTTRFTDVFTSIDGAEWDSVEVAVTVPAGATSLTAQALSVGDGTDNLPASFTWIMAGLTVPTTPPETTTTSTTSTTVPETTTTTSTTSTTSTTVPETTTTTQPGGLASSTTLPTEVGGIQINRQLARTGGVTSGLLWLSAGLIVVGLGLIAFGDGRRVLAIRRR